jgi:uncharacterized repeat protein (TIGR04076 family)
MTEYKIRCDVVKVDRGTACQRVGDSFTFWKRTPANMCCRAFAAVYPSALAMRFSEGMPGWDDGGHIDVTCPDGHVVYRLTRPRADQP